MTSLVEEMIGDGGKEATISEFEESYEVLLAQDGKIEHKTFFPLDEFGLELARDWARRWTKGVNYNDNNAE
tara:strand:+ start:39350 stop:39562 length:213 start_codon:yes stop_codon:yes gene_type:complete